MKYHSIFLSIIKGIFSYKKWIVRNIKNIFLIFVDFVVILVYNKIHSYKEEYIFFL